MVTVSQIRQVLSVPPFPEIPQPLVYRPVYVSPLTTNVFFNILRFRQRSESSSINQVCGCQYFLTRVTYSYLEGLEFNVPSTSIRTVSSSSNDRWALRSFRKHLLTPPTILSKNAPHLGVLSKFKRHSILGLAFLLSLVCGWRAILVSFPHL